MVRGARGARGALTVALVLVATALTACSGPAVSAPPSAPPNTVRIPLSAATSASGGWATVAMGHLGDPLNTFWELFHLTGTPARWTLATPPGVASNGGLVLAPGAGNSLAAGFEPTDLLHFSPLSLSSNGAASWTTGTVPGELLDAPDALAAAGTGYLALLRTGGGTLVANDGDLNTWTTTSVPAGLTPAGCGPTVTTAVAALADGSPVIGGDCTRGTRAAILLDRGGRWTSVGPVLPVVTGRAIRVVRLVGTADGAAALLRTGDATHGSLFAAWSRDDLATWSVSPALTTAASDLASTSVTPADGFVVTAGGTTGSRLAAVIDPGSSAWHRLPAPPSGTAVVAALPNGGYDAMTVDQSTLDVSTLGDAGWTLQARVKVPVSYGSSG